MSFFKAILPIVLSVIVASAMASAADFAPGKWMMFTEKGGDSLGIANITVTRDGKIVGKGMTINGAVARVSGSIRGKKVTLTERAPNLRNSVTGIVSSKGTQFSASLDNGVKVRGYSLKGKYKNAGIYLREYPSGDVIFMIVDPDGKVTGFATDRISYAYELTGQAKGDSISVQSKDGELYLDGSISSGVIKCSGYLGESKVYEEIKYLK